jgi:hypothetical protein
MSRACIILMLRGRKKPEVPPTNDDEPTKEREGERERERERAAADASKV